MLLARPKLLLMDEPTEGIQPSVIDQIEEAIERIKGQGISVLLVEQYLEFAWRLAFRVRDHAQGHHRVEGRDEGSP